MTVSSCDHSRTQLLFGSRPIRAWRPGLPANLRVNTQQLNSLLLEAEDWQCP
jgi:hypothetical protein